MPVAPSIRGIVRELGIQRNTARKYAASKSSPLPAHRNLPVTLADTMKKHRLTFSLSIDTTQQVTHSG